MMAKVPGRPDTNIDLASMRKRIDEVDRQIQSLISERARFAQQVGISKGELASAVDYYRPEREAEVLRNVLSRNEGPLRDEEMLRLFREIMSACLAQQEPLRSGFWDLRELSPKQRYISTSGTRYGHCRSGPLTKYFRKLNPEPPILASYPSKTPPRARLTIRWICFLRRR
jgi:chorismate mutase-like protein